MNVIVIANVKGGSGKTSAAVPLATTAMYDGNTMLLDLDPTPDGMTWISAAGLIGSALSVHTITPDQLEEVLDAARDGLVETVIVDTPSVMRDVMLEAMFAADLVLIPVHVGSGDSRHLVETVRLLGLPRKHKPDLKVLVVMNYTGTMPAVTRSTREEIERFGLTMAQTEIPFRTSYAMAKGRPPQGEHYAQLWTEIRRMLA